MLRARRGGWKRWAWLLPLIVAAGCLPVPTPGELVAAGGPACAGDGAAFSSASAFRPLQPTERVAVLARPDVYDMDDTSGLAHPTWFDVDETADYTASVMRSAAPGLQTLSAAELQELLRPWLRPSTAPSSADELLTALALPEPRAAARRAGIRAVVNIDITDSAVLTYGTGGPVLSPVVWMAAVADEYGCKAAAAIEDLDEQVAIEPATVVSRGKRVAFFFIVSGFDAMPMVKRTALKELGRRLGLFLTGKAVGPDLTSSPPR